jgi:2-methylcitrate dehydratase PrpD
VDCALDIRSRVKWTQGEVLDAVSGVEIETYGPGYEIVKEMNPRTPYQAKFSLAYCVAAALAEGRLGLEQFDAERFGPDGVRDPAIFELMRRIRVVVAADLTAKYPAAWPVRLTLKLRDGTSERGSSDYPRGNAENPVSTEELELKLTALVGSRFGDDKARSALAVLHSMERCADMATLFNDLGRLPASASAAIMGSYGVA